MAAESATTAWPHARIERNPHQIEDAELLVLLVPLIPLVLLVLLLAEELPVDAGGDLWLGGGEGEELNVLEGW